MPNTRESEVIIIGSGCAGGYLGQRLKRFGYSPIILEEHPAVGVPVQCSGVVGHDLFDEAEIELDRRTIVNTLDAGRIIYRNDEFTIAREGVAYVLDREKYDKSLADGLDVRLNTKVLDIGQKGGEYVISTTQGQFRSRILIGADGPHSIVRKKLGFDFEWKAHKGLEYRMRVSVDHPRTVEVKFLKPFSHFCWIIPEGCDYIRIGAMTGNPRRDLHDYIDARGIQGEIVQVIGGAIPHGFGQTVKGNAALIGDAACQIKPITAGGIYYNMKAGNILARVIADNHLSEYDQKWKELFGKEIKFCLIARDILEQASDEVLLKVFRFFKENSDIISKTGNFESHSSVFWALIANPRAYQTAGYLIWDVINRYKYRPWTPVSFFRKKKTNILNELN